MDFYGLGTLSKEGNSYEWPIYKPSPFLYQVLLLWFGDGDGDGDGFAAISILGIKHELAVLLMLLAHPFKGELLGCEILAIHVL